MTETEFNHLIQKYREGKATEKEKVLLDAWFASIENDQREFTWNKRREELQFRTIRKKIRVSEDTGKAVPFYSATWLQVAASLSLLIIFSYGLWYSAFRNETRVVRTAAENTEKVILSDGTLVWLKGKSMLQFPERFGNRERTVCLKGEALFEVAKDSRHPFVIQSGSLRAKALGTSFNIKTSDKDIELMVLTGAVELYAGNNQNSVVVLPNQKVMYDGLPQQFKGTIAEAEKATLIKGTEYDMTFRNTSMGTILQRIEGKFNMQVHLDNSKLAGCLITADFTDQSLEDTLSMVGHILSFEYEINGNKITIKGGGCGFRSP